MDLAVRASRGEQIDDAIYVIPAPVLPIPRRWLAPPVRRPPDDEIQRMCRRGRLRRDVSIGWQRCPGAVATAGTVIEAAGGGVEVVLGTGHAESEYERALLFAAVWHDNGVFSSGVSSHCTVRVLNGHGGWRKTVDNSLLREIRMKTAWFWRPTDNGVLVFPGTNGGWWEPTRKQMAKSTTVGTAGGGAAAAAAAAGGAPATPIRAFKREVPGSGDSGIGTGDGGGRVRSRLAFGAGPGT